MADEDYRVVAELELRVTKAEKGVKDVAKKVNSLERGLKKTGRTGDQALSQMSSMFNRVGAAMRGASGGVSSLTRNLVLMGGTYLGIRAVSDAVRSLATATFQVNSSVEDITTSIAAMTSEIEGISFEEGRRTADGLFRRLNDIAVQSPATATQLADIFTGVMGPLRSAGASMESLLGFTQNASAVGRVLRVDYEQLSRDVAGMATGVAGTDNKTFRLLRSMRLITKSTEQWNEMAKGDSARAAQELLDVFEQLGGPAADAFGRTWTGVSSTFTGLVEQFTRVFSSATFNVIKNDLRRVNEFLIRYRTNIENLLSAAGSRLGEALWDAVSIANLAFNRIIGNLDAIAARIDTTVSRVGAMMPMLGRIARGLAIFAIVGRVLGPLFGLLGAAGGMLSGVASIGGALGVGGGAAAAGAGGAAAAAGGGPLGALFATLSAAAAPLAAVFAVLGAGVVAVWAALSTFGSEITALFDPVRADLTAIGANLMDFFMSVWSFLQPVFAFIGALIIGTFGGAIRFIVPVIRVVTTILAAFGRWIRFLSTNYLGPMFEALGRAFLQLVDWVAGLWGILSRFAAWVAGIIGIGGGGGGAEDAAPGFASGLLASLREAWDGPGDNQEPTESQGTGTAPGGRPSTNVDARGARITVNQEFRDQDPDRVWMVMRRGVEQEATRRISTGFAPALTR
jgi:methyl-accepting chemotaxis protein